MTVKPLKKSDNSTSNTTKSTAVSAPKNATLAVSNETTKPAEEKQLTVAEQIDKVYDEIHKDDKKV